MTLLATDFDFALPDELIAKFPAEKRNLSRLLYFTGENKEVQNKNFEDIISLLPNNALMVRNNTQVIPARCYGKKITGAKIEILVERITSSNSCLAHLKSNRPLKNGDLIIFPLEQERIESSIGEDLLTKYIKETLEDNTHKLSSLEKEATEKQLTLAQIKHLKSCYNLFISLQEEDKELTLNKFFQLIEDKNFVMQVIGRKSNLFKLSLIQRDNIKPNIINSKEAKEISRATSNDSILDLLYIIGHMPLPPYMNREDAKEDENRYQTVYAKEPGAVAAPTAGLHFTPEILEQIKSKNIDIIDITLHVGAGTFMPLKTDIIKQHVMHAEWIDVSQHTVDIINKALKEKRPIVAVGTTSVRALESIAQYSLEKYIYKKEEQDTKKAITNKLYSLRIKELLLTLGETNFKLLVDFVHSTLENSSNKDNFDFNIKELVDNINNIKKYLAKDNYIEKVSLDNQKFFNSLTMVITILSNSIYFENITPDKNIHNHLQNLDILRRKFKMIQDPLTSFSSYYMNTNLEFGTEVELLPLTSDTSIFIHPGHKVHLVDYLITNFHLPKSTLIMLVSAFIGRDYCLSAYQHAIENKYRFYSYGDSCFIPNIKKSDSYQYII